MPEHTIYEGFLKVDIPERIEPKTFEHVHLLESMAVILKSIQGSYGEFLTIKELYNYFIDFTGGRHVVFHFSNISLFNDMLEN